MKTQAFKKYTTEETYDILVNNIVLRNGKHQKEFISVILMWLLQLKKNHPYLNTLSGGSIRVYDLAANTEALQDIVSSIVVKMLNVGTYKHTTFKNIKDATGAIIRRDVRSVYGAEKSLKSKLDLTMPKYSLISYVYTFVRLSLYSVIEAVKLGPSHETYTSYIYKNKAKFAKIKDLAENIYLDPFLFDPYTTEQLELQGIDPTDISVYRLSLVGAEGNNILYDENKEAPAVEALEPPDIPTLFIQAKLSLIERYVLCLYYGIPLEIITFDGKKDIIVTIDLLSIVYPEAAELFLCPEPTIRGGKVSKKKIFKKKLIRHSELFKTAMQKLIESVEETYSLI